MSTYSYQILHPVDRDTRQPEAGDLDFVTISLTQSAGGRMQARGAAPNTVYWHWSSYGGKELEDGLGNEEGVDAQTWAFPFFAPSPEDEPATSRQVTLAHLRQANTMARLSLLLMIISGLYMITLTIALCTTITSPSPISFESNTDPNSDDSDAFWGHTRSRFGPILVPVLITFAIQLFAAYLASTVGYSLWKSLWSSHWHQQAGEKLAESESESESECRPLAVGWTQIDHSDLDINSSPDWPRYPLSRGLGVQTKRPWWVWTLNLLELFTLASWALSMYFVLPGRMGGLFERAYEPGYGHRTLAYTVFVCHSAMVVVLSVVCVVAWMGLGEVGDDYEESVGAGAFEGMGRVLERVPVIGGCVGSRCERGDLEEC